MQKLEGSVLVILEKVFISTEFWKIIFRKRLTNGKLLCSILSRESQSDSLIVQKIQNTGKLNFHEIGPAQFPSPKNLGEGCPSGFYGEGAVSISRKNFLGGNVMKKFIAQIGRAHV